MLCAQVVPISLANRVVEGQANSLSNWFDFRVVSSYLLFNESDLLTFRNLRLFQGLQYTKSKKKFETNAKKDHVQMDGLFESQRFYITERIRKNLIVSQRKQISVQCNLCEALLRR